jgi:putative phosphoribosyl transferase
MDASPPPHVVDLPLLRSRTRVFRDRADGGRALAAMLCARRGTSSIVLAIPAGGVPVGAALAGELGLPLDVAGVSKITLPWNTEAGYGAVAFDGSVLLNEALLSQLSLSEEVVQLGIARTRQKVERRVIELRGERPFPDLEATTAVLVDDGLASGFTMRAAVQAVRGVGAAQVLVATPTGHADAVAALAPLTDGLYCANVRSGSRFAVAEAYERWYDVPAAEVRAILAASADA